MSFDRFADVVSRASLHPNDRVWFKRWLGRYRQFCGVGPRAVIPTDLVPTEWTLAHRGLYTSKRR